YVFLVNIPHFVACNVVLFQSTRQFWRMVKFGTVAILDQYASVNHRAGVGDYSLRGSYTVATVLQRQVVSVYMPVFQSNSEVRDRLHSYSQYTYWLTFLLGLIVMELKPYQELLSS
ncbi:hypothetical protein, partial [Vibrio anguillarum]